jgi:hypothetical protein
MPEAARVTIPVETNAGKASVEMGKLDKSLLKTSKSTKGLAGSFGGLSKLFAAGALIVGFKKIISETNASAFAQSQLNAVLKSTKYVAGVTADEMNNLATSLQKVSLFDDDAIVGAESLLLTFTKIGGDVIPQATQAILNVSQAMGQDLKSSTIQLGKALNDPILGISALSRVGIQLTEDQKGLIKSFVAVGDVAGAQKIILSELETQFGGAAEAATKTLGGALKQLANTGNNALEALGGGLTPGLGDLARAMQEALQEGGVFVEGLVIIGKALGSVAKGLANIVDLFNYANKAISLKNAQKETDNLIAGLDQYRDQAQIALGLQTKSNKDLLTQLKKIIDTETDPRRVKVAKSIYANYRRQLGAIQDSQNNANKSLDDMGGIVARVNGEMDEAANKMAALTDGSRKAANATSGLKLSAEEYTKVLESARGILAGGGDVGAFLALQRDAFAQQVATVKAAGLNVAGLEKFQQQQRLSQFNDFFAQSITDESKGFEERQKMLDEQYKAISESESVRYEEKLAAQQAYNEQSMLLERARLQAFASTVALAGSALSDVGAIAGSISQIQQNNMEAEIAALEKKGATAEQIEKKRAELARKAAKDSRNLSLFSIAINTAVSVTKTLAEYGYTPMGVGLSILAGAKGLAEAAAVASTPIPAAQFGGRFTVAPGNEADSGLLKVNSGEEVNVTPTRQSGNSGNNVYKLVVGEREFKAYLVEMMNSIANSGEFQIYRKGAVKTA